MSNPHIRTAGLGDLDALCAIESESFTYDQIGRRSFAHLLRSSSARVFVYQNDDELVAYAIVLTRRNSRYWRLYSMATRGKARGQGVGKAMLGHILQVAQQNADGLRLEVKCDNLSALSLYRQLGFEVLDFLPQYYSDHSDGYRMQLTWGSA